MSKPDLTLFNPEAGHHPLPDDPREIEAVLQAGRRCYALHPYFAERYGARGEAFTRSDGGYLATLAGHPMGHVMEQTTWLARLLAARGMPRWLMETHLDLLADELTTAVPEQADSYAKLRQAAQALRNERLAVIRSTDFDFLNSDFDSGCGPVILLNAGGLLVAAVCDEYCGIPQALSSLLSWLNDPRRFPTEWRARVAITLARARALAMANRGAPP
jgi:hypothetical protein